ncbi:MAG TPA: hypothetical protein VFO66_13680 [Gemmatimonadaceae bacterium]|nr:hypothetical protein [Gemmatimonadaceae bacterium]
MSLPRNGAVAIVASILWAGAAAAQGTLSTQGLGYPPGQLSTPARTMGGSTGEVDPLSALNPAALALLRNPIIFMQAEPEFRTLQIGAESQRTSVARFPLFVGALSLGSRWTAGVSASTLFDRTWATVRRDTQVVGIDTLGSDITQRSDGSVADLRVAVAFASTPWLRVGVAGHVYSGRDLMQTARLYDDTARFQSDTQTTTLSFGGNAVTLGAHAFWPRVAALGVSYRKGGSLSAYNGGDKIASGTAPDHIGLSAVYLGVRGASFAVRVANDTWKNVSDLSPTLNIHSGLDIGVGADVIGPRFAGNAMNLRAGGRWRTLPFSSDGNAVRESSWSGGFGLPFAGGRAEVNVGALRSNRTSDSGISEKAWTLSTGFGVRP